MQAMVAAISIVLSFWPASVFGASTETAAADEPTLLGMPSVDMRHPFHAALYREGAKAAEHFGAKLVLADSQGYANNQTKNIKDLVAQGVRGIVISPMPGVEFAIDDAVRAGVPVATVDNVAKTDKVLVHAGVDNVEVGRAAARFIIEKLGNKGSVIEFEGLPGQSATTDRKAGFDEVIKASKVKLLTSQPASWSRNTAHMFMATAVKTYPGFDAVFAANDDMILGAMDALTAANIDPASKLLVGVDATPEALRSIRSGQLSATVDQVPSRQAQKAIEYLVGYIKNKTMPPQKVVLIEPELITKDSVPSG